MSIYAITLHMSIYVDRKLMIILNFAHLLLRNLSVLSWQFVRGMRLMRM